MASHCKLNRRLIFLKIFSSIFVLLSNSLMIFWWSLYMYVFLLSLGIDEWLIINQSLALIHYDVTVCLYGERESLKTIVICKWWNLISTVKLKIFLIFKCIVLQSFNVFLSFAFLLDLFTVTLLAFIDGRNSVPSVHNIDTYL